MPNAPCRPAKRIAVAAGVALALAAGAPRAEIIDRLLAVVNGALITQTDVYGAVAFGLVDAKAPGATSGGADWIEAALDRVIERELVLVEVNRYAPAEPSEAEVTARVDAVLARFPSPEAYRHALAATGYTADRIRGAARDEIRIETYLDQRFGFSVQPADREALIAEWKAGLRRRADIIIQYQPQRPAARGGRSPAR